MPKAYIQLGASCSSPSICPTRVTGWLQNIFVLSSSSLVRLLLVKVIASALQLSCSYILRVCDHASALFYLCDHLSAFFIFIAKRTATRRRVPSSHFAIGPSISTPSLSLAWYLPLELSFDILCKILVLKTRVPTSSMSLVGSSTQLIFILVLYLYLTETPQLFFVAVSPLCSRYKTLTMDTSFKSVNSNMTLD